MTEKRTTFTFTGGKQEYRVPPGVFSLHLSLLGAAGGGLRPRTLGLGGQATATLCVDPGDVVTVIVGGRGQDPNLDQVARGGFGAQPGGDGGNVEGSGKKNFGGGGGGSTAIIYKSKQLIAGGGGGDIYDIAQGSSGHGGGLAGTDGVGYFNLVTGGKGGTQVQGGLGGGNGAPGTDKRGGNGGSSTFQYSGGGGGGGFYGGGGGGGGDVITNIWEGSGGGGSGHSDRIFTNAQLTIGVNDGDGIVQITALPHTVERNASTHSPSLKSLTSTCGYLLS